jgi:hypothetical protein
MSEKIFEILHNDEIVDGDPMTGVRVTIEYCVLMPDFVGVAGATTKKILPSCSLSSTYYRKFSDGSTVLTCFKDIWKIPGSKGQQNACILC